MTDADFRMHTGDLEPHASAQAASFKHGAPPFASDRLPECISIRLAIRQFAIPLSSRVAVFDGSGSVMSFGQAATGERGSSCLTEPQILLRDEFDVTAIEQNLTMSD